MKKMSSLMALSLVTAVLCGLWAAVAPLVGLVSWAGFAGCTTYFACGKHGLVGLKKTIFPNLAGVLCAMAVIWLSGLIPALGDWGVWCAILTFVMCIIAKYELFDFCPGTFLGCFSTFAAGGDWAVLVPSLLVGALLGMACDLGGDWLYRKCTKQTCP